MRQKNGVYYPSLFSFFLSSVLYISLFLFFVAHAANRDKIKSTRYTDDLNAYIDIAAIDIDDTPIPTAAQEQDDKEETQIDVKTEEVVEEEQMKTTPKPVQKAEETPQPEPKEAEAKVEEKLEPIEANKVIEFNTTQAKPKESAKNLFEMVEIKEQKVQANKKSDKETKAEKKASSQQIAQVKADKSTGKSQRTGQYDAFWGKVDKIAEGIWNSYNPPRGEVGRFELSIDRNGRAKCRVVELGFSQEFNQKLRDFVARLEGVKFPNPPTNETITAVYRTDFK